MRNSLVSVCLFSFCMVGVAQAAPFKGDCLEMRCAYKCSENAEGVGKCCKRPTKQSCKHGTRDSFGCVITEKITCPADRPICGDDGACRGCISSSECPDLRTYCSDGQCVPCNTQGTGIRPGADAEYCDCPEGYTKRCGSIKTTTNCVDGASWVCTNGCFDNTDCPTDQYCSCNGKNCPTNGGTCQPCPSGTHRAEASATDCVACTECQEWNETEQKCVSLCAEGELCMQMPGTSTPVDYTQCGGDMCMSMPDRTQLIHLTGTINGRDFYLSPTGDYYKLSHTSASRFCEYYGMHLATVTEACSKDYSYDTGHDCPNIAGNQTFTDNGVTYNLSAWAVESYGSFWLANMSATDALRVTWSCGNNHSTNICNRFYPLCTTK